MEAGRTRKQRGIFNEDSDVVLIWRKRMATEAAIPPRLPRGEMPPAMTSYAKDIESRRWTI